MARESTFIFVNQSTTLKKMNKTEVAQWKKDFNVDWKDARNDVRAFVRCVEQLATPIPYGGRGNSGNQYQNIAEAFQIIVEELKLDTKKE